MDWPSIPTDTRHDLLINNYGVNNDYPDIWRNIQGIHANAADF